MNKKMEDDIEAFWKEHNVYENVRSKKGKPFYFLDGPPYATGSVHIGTALNKILKDTYIRFWRMNGYSVWDKPGFDTHGLPIENQVEREVQIKSKADIEQMGIEAFTSKCREFATRFIDVMSKQFNNMGIWMDWKNPYLTLTNDYIEGAWYTFKIAYEKGLLYKGSYPVHVCTRCQTAVAYNEIEYAKVIDPSIYVKFATSENEYLVIWTTTPWTLIANAAVMINPNAEYVKVKVDNKILIIAEPLIESVMKKVGSDYEIVEKISGKDLSGISYKHPLVSDNLERRVVLNEQFVTMDTGTGLVHCAPGHGSEDYKVGVEYNLPVISHVGMNGVFTKEVGDLAGLYVKSADKKIIEKLKNSGNLLHEETIMHDYPQCWRCDTRLLQIAVPQWFFAVTKIRDRLLEENANVKWYPSWAKQRFQNWLENLGDWPISRQRYWGIPLPIWTCNCGNVKIIGSLKDLPVKLDDLHRPYIDAVEIACKCGGNMKRIPDVLDIWFDSGLASWASIGYPKNAEIFKEMWPAELNIEGPDQIRGWWNSQLITSVITFDKAPFKKVLLHGFVLDAHGAKMSKSKGNVVAPEDVINKYGRDVLRFYLTSSPAWNDFLFNWNDCDAAARFFTVAKNTFNFVKIYASSFDGSVRVRTKDLKIEDKWILSKLYILTKECTKSYKNYEVHKASQLLSEFILNDFSRWYIKLVRDRVWPAYEGPDKKAAKYTLVLVTKTVAKLLAPICPYLSEYVWQNVISSKDSVHLEGWPKAVKVKSAEIENIEKEMEIVKQIVEQGLALRHDSKIKARWPLKEIAVRGVDNSFVDRFSDVITFMTNVKTLTWMEGNELKIELDTELTPELKKEAMIREITRKIQDMRKRGGLVVSDRISAKIYCSGEEFPVDMILKEVGADKIEFGQNDGENIEFDGLKISVKIQKL